MTAPLPVGAGLDLIRAVAEHADSEASDLQAKAADLRAQATALDQRATVLLDLHRIAKPHCAETRSLPERIA